MVATDEQVPIYTSLESVYDQQGSNLPEAQSRYQRLKTRFSEIYGDEPELYARAPGRVNLIGEHIDYEGYSVLPMALVHDTIVAIRKQDQNSPILRIANMNSKRFPECSFPADPSQNVDRKNHMWGNYFLCGYKGVFEYLHEKGIDVGTPAGYDVLVDGSVPIGAGVSSSSALVCSSYIAIMASLGLSFSKQDVAEFTCICERHIGTQSGGMDQAISVMAEVGVAKLIAFNPIRASDVVLPKNGAFVIANSLTESTKAVSAASKYNYRVVECRLAAMVLAVKLGMAVEEVQEKVHNLSDVEGLCMAYADIRGASTPLLAVEAHLHEDPYTAKEIETILEMKLSDLMAESKSSLEVLAAAESYHLLKRAKHVYKEAQRVYGFRDIVMSAYNENVQLMKLGFLMDESHASCSKLYECSCPELEELVKVCRNNGALGARLTGAGWGGCVVALIDLESVPSFIESVKKEFFQQRIDSGVIREDDLNDNVFASIPAGGAAVLKL